MSSRKDSAPADEVAAEPQKEQHCFAIMPISDHPEYPADHFSEVYENIISPASVACDFTPLRADQVAATNLIHLDILKRILEAPIAICDLSSANPNVMFELGLRQAFDRPVVLIKDERTRKIFDIDNVRTISYSSEMRPRSVRKAVELIVLAIKETLSARKEDGANSIVALLGLHAAAIKHDKDNPNDARITLLERQLSNIASKVEYIAGASAATQEAVRKMDNYLNYPRISANRLAEAVNSPNIFTGSISAGPTGAPLSNLGEGILAGPLIFKK